jgi:hypothetical protein
MFMKKLIITEEEKNRILRLHSGKKSLSEDTGCQCKDGTMSVECCEKNSTPSASVAPKPAELTQDQKDEIILKAELLKRKEEELKSQQIEQEKKTKIAELQKQLDQTYNDILSKPKMDKYQQKIFNDKIALLKSELVTLEGGSSEKGGDPEKRTADQKVSAWVSIASSLLALFSTAMMSFKKTPSQTGN